MYDKFHTELALGNQQLLLFITFYHLVIILIIQKVLYQVYYRQMHTHKKSYNFSTKNFFLNLFLECFVMPKTNYSYSIDISSLLSSMVVLKKCINISILKSIKNLMTLKILYLKYMSS